MWLGQKLKFFSRLLNQNLKLQIKMLQNIIVFCLITTVFMDICYYNNAKK